MHPSDDLAQPCKSEQEMADDQKQLLGYTLRDLKFKAEVAEIIGTAVEEGTRDLEESKLSLTRALKDIEQRVRAARSALGLEVV